MAKRKTIPDPRQTFKTYFEALDHFFASTGGFKTSKAAVKKLFHYAFSDNSIPQKEEIPVLRSLQKEFNALLETTYQAHEGGMFSFIPLHEDVFHPSGHPRPEAYIDLLAGDDELPWDNYPRFLSRQEFINPQHFFEKFFAYHELLRWKTLFEELFHAGLLHQSVLDFSEEVINPDQLQQHLFGFVECSHLLKVRHRYLFPTYFPD